MTSLLVRLALALAAIGLAAPSAAQAPSSFYSPLLLNPHARQLIFRLNGVPWRCPDTGRCDPVRLDTIADEHLPQAAIASLGHSERRYYLRFQHPRYERGRPIMFECSEGRCAKSSFGAGEYVHLGTFPMRGQSRSAILHQDDDRDSRSQILQCSDDGCSEIALTRDNDYSFEFLGRGRFEEREHAWLRERSGAIFSCWAGEDSERLTCGRTPFNFPGFDDAERRALVAAVEAAIAGNDLARAERLVGEGMEREPGDPAWAQLRQRITQIRADTERQGRIAQARRLVSEARRFAADGDYVAADRLLQDAARLLPNFGEIEQARNEIARLRAGREQRLRERGQFTAAIDRAFGTEDLWEVERLIAEALRRFPNDAAFTRYRERLARERAESEWQARIQRAREFVAAARQSIALGDYARAERQLDRAEQAAPGLPEIAEARADIARLRVETERRNDDIRQLTAAIEAAIARHRLGEAERLLADGARRYPNHPGWADLRRQLSEARARDDQAGRAERARDLVRQARRAAEDNDFARAERLLNEAAELMPNLPEIQQARAEIDRTRNERRAFELRAQLSAIERALSINRLQEAERLLAEAERRFPGDPAVASLRSRIAQMRGQADREQRVERARQLIADSRRAGGAGQFEQAERLLREAEALAPDLPELRSARADLDRQRREADQRAPAERLRQLLTQAREALRGRDLARAERLVAEAERLNANAPDVKTVRAELETAKREVDRRDQDERLRQLLGQAREALRARNLTRAEQLVVEAEKLNANAPDVKTVRAELETAKREVDRRDQDERLRQLLGQAREALRARNLTRAEQLVVEAEKLNANAPEVRTVRAELEVAKRLPGATPPTPPGAPTAPGTPPAAPIDEAKLRATYHGLVMAELRRTEVRIGNQPPQNGFDAYRAAQGNKAVAFCMEWARVRTDAIAGGPIATVMAPPQDQRPVQPRALEACRQRAQGRPCTCVLVDVNGRNVLDVPDETVQRLSRSP